MSTSLKSILGLACLLILPLSNAQVQFPGEGQTQTKQVGRPSDVAGKSISEGGSPNDPQTRFFPGVLSGITSFLNPCSRCNIGDVNFAKSCCQRGEVNCCAIAGSGPGFGGPGLGFGGHGGGFGGHGAGFGGHGGGLGGHGAGFGSHGAGFGGHGAGFGGHGAGFGNNKFGICPKPNIIKDFLGIRKLDEEGPAGGPRLRSAPEGNDRPKRQAGDPTKRVVDDSQTRFFPGLEKFPNPFCRDECFSDINCPGVLKCCLNSGSCRRCTNPRFF